METSALHESTELYEQRNNFLYFLLGIVSLSETLMKRLGAAGSETAHNSQPESLEVQPPELPTDLLR